MVYQSILLVFSGKTTVFKMNVVYEEGDIKKPAALSF